MYRVSVTIDVTPLDAPMATYATGPAVDVAGDPLPQPGAPPVGGPEVWVALGLEVLKLLAEWRKNRRT